MSQLATIQLPRGLFDTRGQQHREVWLRPVTGHLEVQFASARRLDARTVSELLASAVERIGGYAPVTAAHTAMLSRGDRQLLLLQLRRGLLGDELQLVVTCPNPGCREEADLDVSLDDLAGGTDRSAPEVQTVQTPSGAVSLRPPTGLDDEAVEGLPRQQASALLWSRLVVDVDGNGPMTPEEWTGLDLGSRHAIALALADEDTGPTLAFAAPCPHCGAWMEVVLDPAALLATELGVAEDRLFAEVHTLAFFYHWGQDEILALPRSRRWRYLELLGRQVSGRPLLGERS